MLRSEVILGELKATGRILGRGDHKSVQRPWGRRAAEKSKHATLTVKLKRVTEEQMDKVMTGDKAK